MKSSLFFPGYGSQYAGMGKELFNEYHIIRQCFQDASDYLDMDFEKICFSSPNEEIDKIENAYPALFLLSCALFDLLKESGMEISSVAGYDTGQYAALYAADGITFFQGLKLLKTYGELYKQFIIDQNFIYALLQVNGLTTNQLTEFLREDTYIAVYLSRTQHIISGTKDGIAHIKLALDHASKVTLYDVPIGLGLNAPLMDPIVKEFAPHLTSLAVNDLTIPLISNVDGNRITQGKAIGLEILSLINHPVRWDKVVDAVEDIDTLIGIGPKISLLDLPTEKYPQKTIITIETPEDVKKAISL